MGKLVSWATAIAVTSSVFDPWVTNPLKKIFPNPSKTSPFFGS
jgi:hypothetical protein